MSQAINTNTESDAGSASDGVGHVERIGLLLIHGIGDQARFDHLKNIVSALVEGTRDADGSSSATVTTRIPDELEVGGGLSGRSADLSIVVKRPEAPDTVTIIDVREVWWQDVAENPSVLTVAKFWWWALTFCAHRKTLPEKSAEFSPPDSISVRRRRVPYTLRLSMFMKTSAFFVVLLPIHVAFEVVSIFPLFNRVHIFRTVFAYLNSIRLYEQDKSEPAFLIDNLFECRRLSILRRASEGALAFAEGDYDRWYIFGHSLGSVIGHNLINLAPEALSRLLKDIDPEYRPFQWKRTEPPSLDESMPNLPERPSWEDNEVGMDPTLMFRKLRGFVSYGSPLETFAGFWPHIVMTRLRTHFSKDFEWLNLYDPCDIVASPVVSFDGLQEDVSVTNIPVATHWLFLSAHTGYLNRSAKSPGRAIGGVLTQWMVTGDKFVAEDLKKPIHCTSNNRIRSKRAFVAFQAAVFLIIGGMFLPRIALSVWNVFRQLYYNIISSMFATASSMVRDMPCADGNVCGIRDYLEKLEPFTGEVEDVIVSAAVFMMVFALLLTVALSNRFLSGREKRITRRVSLVAGLLAVAVLVLTIYRPETEQRRLTALWGIPLGADGSQVTKLKGKPEAGSNPDVWVYDVGRPHNADARYVVFFTNDRVWAVLYLGQPSFSPILRHVGVSDDVGDVTRELGRASYVSLQKGTDCHNECIRQAMLSFDQYGIVTQMSGRSVTGVGIYDPIATDRIHFPDEETEH